MFSKRKFITFCNKHNIDISNYWTANDEISILFKQTNIEHITSTPLNQFIYINFKDKEYDETNFQYKPFKKLYDESWDEDGVMWYNYDTFGQMTVPLPLHLYDEIAYTRLFTYKELSPKNTLTTTIPFNTMKQLEHLYTVVYPKLNKDIKDFYNSESFQNTIKTYKDNLQTIKNLRKGTMDLVNKSYNITKKKAELEYDFNI